MGIFRVASSCKRDFWYLYSMNPNCNYKYLESGECSVVSESRVGSASRSLALETTRTGVHGDRYEDHESCQCIPMWRRAFWHRRGGFQWITALLLDTARKVLPLVVTVAGRVGSETPISCEHSSLRGVILEETAEQHFLKHNDAGCWIQDSALMLSISKEVPWYLEDGTGRVFVVGARGATGLELTVASEVFEESGRSLVRGTLDYLQGLKMLGVKRVERVLPTGTALTVVGEAVKDDIGTIRIQRPHKGPFYVSPRSIDQLITNLGKWARWYKVASLGFTLFGVYLMTTHAIRSIMERRRRRALQRRVMEAAAQRQEQKEHERDQSEMGSQLDHGVKRDSSVPDLCVICLEQEYNAVFVPCGHMCCCTSCSSHLSNCPLCRRRIEQIVRTYRH